MIIIYRLNDYIRHFLDLLKDLKFSVRCVSLLFKMYHKHIIKQSKNMFNDAYAIYNNEKLSSINNYRNYNPKEVIWTFWWQGTKNMPYIVKKCICSIKRHSNKHKVIILTKQNLNKYTKLPYYIYNKLNKNEISLTELSDIVRFNILCNYGGLWIDSTVYCVSDLPHRCFRGLYTASGGYPKYCDNISLGRWTSFLIGGNKHQSLFVFMNNLLLLYWRNNNKLIDYFLTDYALNYAYDHNIGNFANYDKNCLYVNPKIYEMENYLNKKIDISKYNHLMKNTFLFKLTYKNKISRNCKNTFSSFLFK